MNKTQQQNIALEMASIIKNDINFAEIAKELLDIYINSTVYSKEEQHSLRRLNKLQLIYMSIKCIINYRRRKDT
jgi:hypothetical protein